VLESIRMQLVQSPIIPIVGELILSNPGTISLGQGVAYYGPPKEAAEAIEAFLSNPENHKYQPVQGIPELIDAIGAKLKAENNIRSRGCRIVVTAGANMGFINAVLAITNPGDEIILQVPYYFNHEMAIYMANCKAVCVPTDDNYQLQVSAIAAAITSKTRAIVTISPNNPTGAVYSEQDLRQVNELYRRKNIYHISDEAYEYFTYDGIRHFSPGSIENSNEHTISLFSLSKAYGFASWRIGWMVIPEHLYMAVKKIQDTILICPPVISQWAALGAMRIGSDYCRRKLQLTAEIREMFINELKAIDNLVTVPRTNGAFYLFMRVHKDIGSMRLVRQLIEEHKVAVIPGMAFGIEDRSCLRIAYGALQKKTAHEGIRRLIKGLKSILDT
jgi:aspartate/methionine/tyrosine aminotransferase